MAKIFLKPKMLESRKRSSVSKIVQDEKEVLEIIASQRKKLGLTQLDLAKYANLARQSVSDIERGKVNPQLSNVLTMLRLCGIKIILEYDEGEDHGQR
jgi:DNA-binding XRE family transcriptional regulator